VTDHSNPLRQDLPRSITPDPGTNGAEVTRTMASIPDVLRDEIDRRPLPLLPSRRTRKPIWGYPKEQEPDGSYLYEIYPSINNDRT
jgi:hypothetical protein